MDSQQTDRQHKTKTMKVTFIIFGILLLLIAGSYLYLKNLMPEHMFNQGKKYLEIGEYDKALQMFDIVAERKAYDSQPVYYQVLALSKLPPTYEHQKQLYEISQLEDVEEASQLADEVLSQIRNQIEKAAGSNYIDNVLFDDLLIRWNAEKPITYTISSDYGIPDEYYNVIKTAFDKWQTATNGQIVFRETPENKNAKITINFVDNIVGFESNNTGRTNPEISNDNNILQRMNIYIRKPNNQDYYPSDKLLTLMEHEIGHALGLGGHSANPEDIMYFDNDNIKKIPGERNITQRDLNTLNLLYKMLPDVIDVPLSAAEYKNILYHPFITTYPGENFELEIQRLISQLQNDRKNIIIWVDLAINYAYKKQYARSNYILYNILPLVKTDVQNQQVILYNLAANYYELKDYKNAYSYLKLAEKIKTDFETQMLDAFIDEREGRLDLAESKLKILSKQNPENIEIALKLAKIYYLKKERKKEIEVIENLIKKNPKAVRDRRVMKYKTQKYVSKNNQSK